jgi:hypothetical protein
MEMGKTTNRYFVASDYDLTLRLQELFHQTVALQAKFDNAELKDERIELELKLEEVHSEISRLVKNMKHLLSDTEIAKKPTPLTLGASKRSH